MHMLPEEEKSIKITKDVDSYRFLPLLSLRGMLVFPNMTLPLEVGREKSIAALERAMSEGGTIALVTQKVAKVNDPTSEDVYEIGTVAEIKQMVRLPDGTVRVVVEGKKRMKILEFFAETACNMVKVEVHNEIVVRDTVTMALMRNAFSDFENYVRLSKKVPPEMMVSVSSIEDPGRLADDVAGNVPIKVEDKQEILEAFVPATRLERLSDILNREIEILEIERKIHVRVRKQMEKSQKEYYLREQIKAIQKELGDRDERQAEVDELKDKMSKLDLPQNVVEKADYELERLEKMPPMAAEAVVVRNYLDWLLALPWNVRTQDSLDIVEAQSILDQDHWGLEKVKERIIEFLAVRQLAGTMKGPILCMAGPPGVGKTSLAKSIARSLDRKFVRFSLGGVRDEAEIRGHRRTYIGAMPGKIIQSLKRAGTKNPVILLDEIDKMSSDFRGDPASALLEVLDPEQNCNFGDHYMEMDFDLSEVLFITTANSLYTIPRPLQDRMEIINVPGYTEYDKHNIAKHFLMPKQIKANGLDDKNISMDDSAYMKVIREYTREAGVRSLERQLGAICRKVACEVVRGEKTSFVIDEDQVKKYLGAERFRYGVAEGENKVGVVNGLAWMETGGDILSIEVLAVKGSGKLTLTGQMGDVMRESAQAGYSYIRSRADVLKIPSSFYEKTDVHIHIPEGAIPKDGPSAGISMATALASALTGRPVRKDVAMTGEITLRGRVLPIGGLKEKSLAAHRAGIKTVIIPEENHKDLEEIPETVRNEMKFVEVSHMDEVLAIALTEKSVYEETNGLEFLRDDVPVIPGAMAGENMGRISDVVHNKGERL